ncbi:MAG TPA: hypothetical protein VFY91_11340 [Microbacterium sp.]|nr:hypothetical protein [Microbacterium sp.]
MGSSLRIAPAFVATGTDDETGLETGLEAHYRRDAGRYIVTTIVNRSVTDDFDPEALRRVVTTPILQAAIPHCISIYLFDEWTTVAKLSATEGRLIPVSIAAEVVKRGAEDARMDAIEIIYGAAALAGLPPVQAVQRPGQARIICCHAVVRRG